MANFGSLDGKPLRMIRGMKNSTILLCAAAFVLLVPVARSLADTIEIEPNEETYVGQTEEAADVADGVVAYDDSHDDVADEEDEAFTPTQAQPTPVAQLSLEERKQKARRGRLILHGAGVINRTKASLHESLNFGLRDMNRPPASSYNEYKYPYRNGRDKDHY